MANDAVYSAIKAFLQANGAAITDPDTGDVPHIRFENEAYEPADTKPWIAMALSSVTYGQQSIGASRQQDNRWDEEGTLWLSAMVQQGSGAERGRQLAKQLANLFRGLRLLSDALEFLNAYNTQGGPAHEDGNWYEIPVAIEWRWMDA